MMVRTDDRVADKSVSISSSLGRDELDTKSVGLHDDLSDLGLVDTAVRNSTSDPQLMTTTATTAAAASDDRPRLVQ